MNIIERLEMEQEKLKQDVAMLMEVLGLVEKENGLATTEQYRKNIRELMERDEAFHINQIISYLESKGIRTNRQSVNQVLKGLRETGDVIAVRYNKSQQKVYYMSKAGLDDSNLGVAKKYRPMPDEYIEHCEVI